MGRALENVLALDSLANTTRVETIAALRALTPPNRKAVVYVDGYYTADDGGGGWLLWVPASTKTDNGGTVFTPDTAPANGRWERGIANHRSFGAKLDDTADDSDAVQRHVTWALSAGVEVEHPGGPCRLAQQIFIRGDALYFSGQGARASAYRVDHDLGNPFVVEHATSPGYEYINAFGMRGISVRAIRETTNGACLLLNKVQMVTLDDVFLEDHFGGIEIRGGNQHYATNLHIFSPRTTGPAAWAGAKPGSFMMKVGRSSDGQIPNELFYTNFNARRTASSDFVENGLIINSCDGLWLNNYHIMGVDDACIRVAPLSNSDQITGIKLGNGWLDNNSDFGLKVVGTTTAAFGVIELAGTLIYGQRVNGIYVDSTSTNFDGINMCGGSIRRTGGSGAMLLAGRNYSFGGGLEFGACNTGATANQAGLRIQGSVGKVTVSGANFLQTALGTTAASMVGIYNEASSTAKVTASGNNFDLAAGAADITDAATGTDANAYPNNTTTKAATATAVAGTSLTIAEIGDQFYVSAGLNFTNMSGRWNQRRVTLVFAGASTVTHGAGGIRLAGAANFVAKAGDTLTLLYSPDLADWIETSRMVS
jgi:hypothetical protein